jgi:hypothetical protein
MMMPLTDHDRWRPCTSDSEQEDRTNVESMLGQRDGISFVQIAEC